VNGRDGDDLPSLVGRREPTLRLLSDGPTTNRDVIDALEVSRSTVTRALRELEEAGFVGRRDGGYATTLAGRFALER